MPMTTEWVLDNRNPDYKMKSLAVVCEKKNVDDFDYLDCKMYDADRLLIGELSIGPYAVNSQWNRPIHYSGIEPHEFHFGWNDLEDE